MRLAQGPQRSDAGESWTLSLESSTLPLSLCAPFLTWYIPLINSNIKWKNNVMATGCIILIQRSYVNNKVNFLWNKPALEVLISQYDERIFHLCPFQIIFLTNLRLSKLIDLSFKYLVNIIQSSQAPPTEERKEKNTLPGPHPSTKFDK